MKGTVIKRGSKWAVVIDLGRDPGGKRIRKWHSGFDTKRAAESARVELLASLAQGLYVPPSRVTLREWLAGWLESRQNLADTTRDAYRWDLRRLEALGAVKLRDLTSAMISGHYRTLNVAPKTVRNTHATLHKALSDAVRQGLLARNPADHVELPRVERADTETWTAGELARFLAHVADHRLYAAWVLICSTGMRRSEVLGVRWQHVDLDAGRVAVVDTVVPVRNKPVLRIGETKSRRSRRVIALDTGTVAVLREHRRRQNEERLRAGPAWSDLGLAFTNELGEMINPPWFTRTTKRLATEAGVPPLTPHRAARHTWATLALASGVHPKVVQERLGHANIGTTLDRYSHVIEGMDRDAAETVAALISGER